MSLATFGASALTTTLGLCSTFLQNDKNGLSNIGDLWYKRSCREHYQTDSGLTSHPMCKSIGTSGTSGGGTYGKYMYGGVALACDRDNRDSCDRDQHYRHDHQHCPEFQA